MAARLKDVADRAGVSIKTVSNVVNGYSFVTDSIRVKVEQAIADLGYRPNLGARNLRGGRTGLIALAVPELAIPYFAELATLIINAAAAHRWTVLIDQTEGQRHRETEIAAGIRPSLIDGAIVSALNLDAADLDGPNRSLPLVLLGERIPGTGVDHVGIDNVLAARDATRHLVSLGRTRIAAIGDQPGQSTGTAPLRLAGYRQALAEAGLAAHPDYLVPALAYHRNEGANAMAHLLRLAEPPDAVFCFNDLLAIGALRTTLEMGLRVPQDVAIIGFDDIEEGGYTTPSLSTIAPDKTSIAEHAVELLRRRMVATDVPTSMDRIVGHRLVIRESTIGR